MEVAFKALEYTVKDSFIESEYRFTGNADTGWTITRNGRNLDRARAMGENIMASGIFKDGYSDPC